MANELPSQPTIATPDTAKRPATAKSGSGGRLRVLLVLAIVLLTGGVVYLFIENQNLKSSNLAIEQDKDNLEEEIQDLEARMTKMDADLDNKGIELEDKDRQLTQLNKELLGARQKVSRLSEAGRLSLEEIEKYKYQIDQMNYYMRKYQKQIEELKVENETLRAENKDLRDDVESAQQQRQEAEQQTRLLSTKLDAAAMLKAVEFSYAGYSTRGNEVKATKGELPGRGTQKLKICFRILENEVAEIGETKIYVTIKGPDGKISSSFETGSGYFTHNGQEVPYSVREVINYDRTAQSLCVQYPAPTDGFLKGRHEVTVYSGGFEIGKSSFIIS